MGPIDDSMLSFLVCIIAEEDLPACIRVDVCDGGKLVGFIRHEVLDDCSRGGGGVTRIASSP